MKFGRVLVLALCVFSVASCNSADKSASEQKAGVGPGQDSRTREACDQVVVPAQEGYGCRIRLVTPSPCEEIDLSNGRTYEFAWTTDGSWCETPYTFAIGGNPMDPNTGANATGWKLSIKSGQITNTGGYLSISAEDLMSLTSDNGIYHWVVIGYSGSHPASQTFRVRR